MFRLSGAILCSAVLCAHPSLARDASQNLVKEREFCKTYTNKSALLLTVKTHGADRCVLDINIDSQTDNLRVASQYTNRGRASECRVSVIIPAGVGYSARLNNKDCAVPGVTLKDWRERPLSDPRLANATWKSVKSERQLGETYPKNSTRPLAISVRTIDPNHCKLLLAVSGQKVRSQEWEGSGGNMCNVTSRIPPNATYQAKCADSKPGTACGSVDDWFELVPKSVPPMR